jgi:cytoskeletal protein RodZ
MSTDSTRNWSRTYISVIVIEVLVLLSLWWLQRHYGV